MYCLWTNVFICGGMRHISLSDEKGIILLDILQNEIWDLDASLGIDPEMDEAIKKHMIILDEIRKDLEKNETT